MDGATTNGTTTQRQATVGMEEKEAPRLPDESDRATRAN